MQLKFISKVFFAACYIIVSMNAFAGKPYPVTITISAAPGQTLKPGFPYALSYGVKGFTTSTVGWTVSQKSTVTATGNCKTLGSTTSGSIAVLSDGAGTCSITVSVNAPDGTGYDVKGSAQFTFQIPKIDPSFAEYGTRLPETAVTGDVGQYLITTSFNPYNGSPVPSITSQTPDICDVSKGPASGLSTLTTNYSFKALASGKCTISYSIPESDDFRAFSTSKTVTVSSNKKQPALSVCTTPDILIGSTGQACFTTDAPVGVSLTSVDSSICTLNDKTITAIATGTCLIRIATIPTDTFDGAVIEQRVNIIAAASDKTKQEIAFGAIPTVIVGGTGTISTTGGASGNPVVLRSLTTDVCAISDLTVTGVDVGNCSIAANQNGDDNFNAAVEAVLKFPIAGLGGKKDQTIAFSPSETLDVGGTTILTAIGGASENPINFISNTPDICTVTGSTLNGVSGSTLNGVSAGVCIVAADQDGNEQFNSAPQVTKIVTIAMPGKIEQSISILGVAPLAVGETATITAIGGKSGQPVALSTLSPTICTLADATVTATAAGTCTIVANQAGSETYAAASQAQIEIRITATSSPFSATISSAGFIEDQTITATFSPSSDDIGQTGSQFVGAIIGGVTVLLDGINRVNGQPNWVTYNGPDSLAAFASGPFASAQEITLIANANLSSLAGAKVYFGYGLGADLKDAYANMNLKKTLVEGYEIK